MKQVKTLRSALAALLTLVMLLSSMSISAFAAETEKFGFLGTRMILGNALDMEFAVDPANITDSTGVYAVINKYDPAGTSVIDTVTVPFADWYMDTGVLVITYPGVAAKEMCNTIEATVYNANGEAISVTQTDNVRDYVMRNLSKWDAKTCSMGVDMLNYGAAAQAQLIYNTADPANNQLTAEQAAWATEARTNTNYLQNSSTYAFGSRLILESRLQFEFALKPAVVTNDMSVRVSYTSHVDGNPTVSKTYKMTDIGEEGEIYVEDSFYVVPVADIAVADGRALVTMEILDANGAVLDTVVDSIEGYAARNASLPICGAVMQFVDGAYAYLHG